MIILKRPFFLCLLGAIFSFWTSIYAKTDFQIWTYDRVTGALNRRMDLVFEVEFRFRNSGKQYYYNHEHIELPIHVTPFLDIGPCYRQIYTLSTTKPQQWNTQFQPNLNWTFFWHLGPYQFYDRSRVAYIIRSGTGPKTWQYRNRIRVYRELSHKLNGVQLFLEDEIFLQQKRRGIYENRTSIGYNVGLFRKIRMELAYRYRVVRGTTGSWEHDNILMVNTFASF